MLSPEEKEAIEAEIARYASKEAVCLDALKIVQSRRGWVSDEALQEVAEFLGLSKDRVDGAATFYNLIFRQPVGRHVIMVCNSVSCWIEGYETLVNHLTRRLGISLGGTTADNRFTVLPVVCLGTCDHAPAMLVDNELHQDLTIEKVDQILSRYG